MQHAYTTPPRYTTHLVGVNLFRNVAFENVIKQLAIGVVPKFDETVHNVVGTLDKETVRPVLSLEKGVRKLTQRGRVPVLPWDRFRHHGYTGGCQGRFTAGRALLCC